MTEVEIQSLLLSYVASGDIAMTNYTPVGWWECDLAVITKTHYFVEYEIKLTKSDLLADAKKERWESRWVSNGNKPKKVGRSKNKHALLRNKDVKCPNRFYYVIPEDLVPYVPDWAGIIVVYRMGNNKRLCRRIERQCPMIHPHKVQQHRITHMLRTGYYRYLYRRIKSGGEVYDLHSEFDKSDGCVYSVSEIVS